VLVAAAMFLAGCGGDAPDFSQVVDREERVVEQRDPLLLGLDVLNRLDEFDPMLAKARIQFHLNQWIDNQEPDEDWHADPLYARLPKRFSGDLPNDVLQRHRFSPGDIDYLRACVWLRDVSQTVVRRQRERMRETQSEGEPAWVQPFAEQSGRRAAEDLLIAMWLFDWTIRHIQLDPMPEAVGETAGPQPARPEKGRPKKEQVTPAHPVAGGQLMGWETLLLGHGDGLERAKVFIGLARQQGIDVVMLHPYEGPRERGWLAGVVIGEDLYLFDTVIGLPVPGPGPAPVATLAQAVADPSIVRSLDVDGEPLYPLKQSEAESMVAYVDASPWSLSQRMRILEDQLAGEQKMVITTSPGPLVQRLRKYKGVADAGLWLTPYETWHYRIAVQRLGETLARAARTGDQELADRVRAAYDRDAIEQLDEELMALSGFTPLVRGRLLQFRGQYDKRDEQPGAKALFMQCRPPDEEIERLKTDRDLQKTLVDLNRLPDQDAETLQKTVQRRIAVVQRIKQNASHWLGLIAYEDGQHQAACHFFDQLSLRASPDGPWSAGAQYNLARAHETLARQNGSKEDYQRAIEMYRTDQSPQRRGSLIRAKRLEEAFQRKGAGTEAD
jgi:tetratricopeptide (TPR) repeat protein